MQNQMHSKNTEPKKLYVNLDGLRQYFSRLIQESDRIDSYGQSIMEESEMFQKLKCFSIFGNFLYLMS